MEPQAREPTTSDEYFSSYSDINVHALMLKDLPRTLVYKTFIETNKALFLDATVIDVGAGTGILSLFAAQSGARKVYAIEASDIALVCQAIVEKNALNGIIEVIHDRVEYTKQLAGVKADIIVSEWMGFYLFHESMLESVLFARDEWLKPGGVMVPTAARLYMCPVNMEGYYQEHFDFWKDVYGFDYTPVLPLVMECTLQQPVITCLTHDQLVSEPCIIKQIDLTTVQIGDIAEFGGTLEFIAPADCRVHGFACWFDVEFSSQECINCAVAFRSDGCDKDNITGIVPHSNEFTEDGENERTDCKLPLIDENKLEFYSEDDVDAISETKYSSGNESLSKCCAKKVKSDAEKIEDCEKPICDAINTRHGETKPASDHTACPADTRVTQHVLTVLERHHITLSPPSHVLLSTSPSAPQTHWKQTVVMLPSPLVVESGDTIGCKVAMAQDATNRRHYSISVELCDPHSESSGDELDTDDHTMPCFCDAPRCCIIRAVMEKYDEQDLSAENVVDISCEEIEAVDEGYHMTDSIT